MHLHMYTVHVISIIYLSKIYWRGCQRVLKFTPARPTLFLENVETTTLSSDYSWSWFRCVCFYTFWQEIHCATITSSTELQQLHPGVFQWGYLASVLQCLAQTSTFTLDIDANVKSLGAIGQALQKVMKDLRSETRQHPIQHRKKGSLISLPDGVLKRKNNGPHTPQQKYMVVVKEVNSKSLQSCVFPGYTMILKHQVEAAWGSTLEIKS